MLTSFLVAVLCAAAILYLPGYLIMRGSGLRRNFAAGVAPAAGIIIIGILAMIYSAAGIASSPLNLFLLPLLVALCLYVVLRRRRRFMQDAATSSEESLSLGSLLVAIALGVAIGMLLFVRRLPSLDAIFQAWDYPHHLNEVKAFVDSGTLSPIHGIAYMADQAVDPFTEGLSFYPSGWHMVCALAVMACNVSVPVAINAVDFTFAFIVFPISMEALLVELAPDRKLMPVIGTVACLSLAVFPWGLLTYGPLFPNLAGFAVLPGMAAAFIEVVSEKRCSMLVTWMAACLGVLFLHPNVLFSLMIFLVPFMIHAIRSWRLSLQIGKCHLSATGICILFCALCAALWVAAYNLPALAATIMVVWRPYAPTSQAIVNLFTLSYVSGFPPSTAAQLIPALILFIGIVSIVRDREDSRRWIVWPFIISAILMVVAESFLGDSPIRHFLLGFWYTDPYRIAAMTTIFSVPILVRGIYCCAAWIGIRLQPGTRDARQHKAVATVIVLYIILVFYPSFNLAGFGKVNMAFTDVSNNIQGVYGYKGPMTEDERDFLEKVKEIVGDDLVINDPYDGSVMAYGVEGIRCYYRYFDGFGTSSETSESKTIREDLALMASEDKVQEAVRSLGAKYVLVLDRSDAKRTFASAVYDKEEWKGIESIDDTIPGFTKVLEEGNLRLYRIDEMADNQ